MTFFFYITLYNTIHFLGTLEEQLATIGLFAHEVANKGGHDLKKVEDLGQILEEHLILDNRLIYVPMTSLLCTLGKGDSRGYLKIRHYFDLWS